MRARGGGYRDGGNPVIFESLIGGLWWTVGALGLASGTDTAVLAVGLAVAVWLTTRGRRGSREHIGPGSAARRRVARMVVSSLVLIAVAVALLGWAGTGYRELAVPVAAAIVGMHLIPLAGVLDRRRHLAEGAALLVLGALGALLGLRSAGAALPQGVVGLGAGAVLWLGAAGQLGLLDELRTKVSSR